MKYVLTILFLITLSMEVYSQDIKRDSMSNLVGNAKISYAYIKIEGKLLSSKLKVEVDLGDNGTG